MIIDSLDQHHVRGVLELAGRAPSVYNTQPWRWVLEPHTVHLYADIGRWLPATDADGRDMVVSCGAALHHLRVALAAAGIAAIVHRLPDPVELDHLAAVELRTGTPTDADISLAKAILGRHTDRHRYGMWEVPDGFVHELIARAAEQGAILRAVTEPAARDLLLSVIHDADKIHDSTPGVDVEAARWTSRLTAMGPGSDGATEQSTGEPDCAMLLVLSTASDDTLSQLRAGEALSAVTLHATELGLATCPLSRPIEVDSTRTAVRDTVLDGTVSPQLVLRIGWATADHSVAATPRRAVDETIGQFPDWT